MKEADRPKIKDILDAGQTGKDYQLKGWVRTKRGNNKIAFVALNDGSTIHNLQVVLDVPNFDEELVNQITTGACIAVSGTLVIEPSPCYGRGRWPSPGSRSIASTAWQPHERLLAHHRTFSGRL